MKTIMRVSGLGLVCLLAACGQGEEEPGTYRLKVVETYSGTTLSARAVHRYDLSSQLTRVDTYKAAGDNGIWGDSDDVLDFYSTCTYQGGTQQSFFDLTVEYGWPAAQPNPVGGKATSCADGIVPKDTLVGESVFVAPGPTGWNKGDDVKQASYNLNRSVGGSQWLWNAGAANNGTRVHSHGFYANGRLKTLYVAQGTFKGFYLYTYRTDGRLLKREFRTDVDSDGIGGDDRLDRYDEITYVNDSRAELCTYVRSDSGFTASGMISDKYDEIGLVEERTATATGGDDKWCTADDVFGKVQRFKYETLN